MKASALLAVVLLATGCVAESDDAAEDVDQTEEALASAAAMRVVQLNPYYAGQFPAGARIKDGKSPPRTFGTAQRFAEMLAKRDADTAVIGMEEAEDAAATERLRTMLESTTKKKWAAKFFPSEGYGNERAIFYRSDVLTLVEDFGSITIDQIDSGTKKYAARFSGALFRKRNTERRFGLFVGKLAWGGAEINGHEVGGKGRVREFEQVLQPWIVKNMAKWPRATRIITMDMNDSYGSDVHDAITKTYDDHGATGHTNDSGKRLDYVFWDRDSGAKTTNGFLQAPRTSDDFGSDHRYVSALVNVRSPAE